MGRQPGRAALRRTRLHARVRNRTAVPRYAAARHRRRHHRDSHRPRRETIGVPVMTVLRTAVDTASPEYAEATAAMNTKLAEVEAEFAKAIAGGGPEKLARHRKR